MAFYEYILLSLVHYIIFVKSLVLDSFVVLKKYALFSLDIPVQLVSVLGLSGLKSSTDRSVWQALKTDATNLRKIPKHVGLVVVEDEFSFTDIANMVVWCVGFGAKFISLYDAKGKFKRNDQVIATEIFKKQETFFQEDRCQFSFEVGKSYIEGKSNGVSDTGKISIKLLSPCDGRQGVVKVSQQVCRAIQDKTQSIEDVNLSHLETLMQARSQCPDPELVIRCGPVHSLLGYLPWQTRLTEIHWINSHIGVDYNDVYGIMQAYSRCDQRLGK